MSQPSAYEGPQGRCPEGGARVSLLSTLPPLKAPFPPASTSLIFTLWVSPVRVAPAGCSPPPLPWAPGVIGVPSPPSISVQITEHEEEDGETYSDPHRHPSELPGGLKSGTYHRTLKRHFKNRHFYDTGREKQGLKLRRYEGKD